MLLHCLTKLHLLVDRTGRNRARLLTLCVGWGGQLPGFEVPVFAGGDQHGGLAVGSVAKAHGCNPGLVGGRDGRVQHKTAGDRKSMLQGCGWRSRKKKKITI